MTNNDKSSNSSNDFGKTIFTRQLFKEIALKHAIPLDMLNELYEYFLDTFFEHLCNGDCIQLRNLGSFQLVPYKSRGFNYKPDTVQLVLKFKSSRTLKKDINSSIPSDSLEYIKNKNDN